MRNLALKRIVMWVHYDVEEELLNSEDFICTEETTLVLSVEQNLKLSDIGTNQED
jgi:hypothetical protein